MRARFLLLATVVVGACSKPSNPGDEGTTDPGEVVDTADTGTPACTAAVVELTPADGTTGFYWRDPLGAVFSEDAEGLATFSLRDTEGGEVAVEATFDETGMNAVVVPQQPLAGATDYVFEVSACDDAASAAFSTSDYGLPLEIDPADLVGRTYHFDLSRADYEEPAGLGPLIRTQLTEPLLVGVVDADDSSITLMGAQGRVDNNSNVVQDTSLPTWDFGSADFSEAPYFEAGADAIHIDYDGIDIPIHSFRFGGTFAPDGGAIGGSRAAGLLDTRNMGPLLNLPDEPGAVCDAAAKYFQLDCVDCPDGEPYCIDIEASVDEASQVEGLTLVAVD